MSDEPEQPTPDNPAVPGGATLTSSEPLGQGAGSAAAGHPAEPPAASDATLTAPAGAAPPMPAMRTPRHGHGRLLLGGQPHNRGGGRHPEKVLAQLIEICGLAADEMLLRLQ